MFLPPPEVEQPNLTQEQLASVRAYEAEVRGSIANSAELETLIRAYRDGKQPVPKVGEPPPAGVTLPKFLVVAAKRDNQWYQAHISGELPDGRVSLRFSGERFDAKLPRADVRLPPPEVKQPNVASPFATATPAAVSSATTAAPQFRTWTDVSGAFQIEARLHGSITSSYDPTAPSSGDRFVNGLRFRLSHTQSAPSTSNTATARPGSSIRNASVACRRPSSGCVPPNTPRSR
jgi:hypothetical protein